VKTIHTKEDFNKKHGITEKTSYDEELLVEFNRKYGTKDIK
jgi:hypothetical protein